MYGLTHLLARFDGRGAVRRFAEVPAVCPACAHHVEPRRLSAHSTSPDDTAVEFVFQCPRDACRRVFVGEYRLGRGDEFELLHALPFRLPLRRRLLHA